MRSLCVYFGAPLLPLLAFAASLSPQTKPAITGVIVAKDGRPIAGVQVWGSAWKDCCPVQYDQTTTGDQGKFVLEHRAAVVHFMKEGFQPMTVVTRSESDELHIVMKPASNSLVLRPCGHVPAGQRQIPSGKYGLHFFVTKREFQVLGGKPDTDYVKYVIKPKKDQSWLELWFGPYAMPSEPEEDQFVQSTDFSQRNVTLPDGAVGIDTSGHLRDGTNWRQMGMLGSGARYTNAPAADAGLFDAIINSACFTPYPSK